MQQTGGFEGGVLRCGVMLNATSIREASYTNGSLLSGQTWESMEPNRWIEQRFGSYPSQSGIGELCKSLVC